MSSNDQFMNDYEELFKSAHSKMLENYSSVDHKVQPIPTQASLGTEVTDVHLDSILPTNPFGAFRHPHNYDDSQGFRRKPTLLNYKLLRNLVKRVEPIAAIIKLRCNQIGAFSHVSRDKDIAGFKISLVDPDSVPTKKEKEEMRDLEKFFLNTGFNHNPSRVDNFEQFQRKLMRDRLTLDAISTQFVANKSGMITEFWAMDAATIYFASEEYNPKRGATEHSIRYVQEVDGQVIAEFTGLELAYACQNATTELRSFGYGESELELLIETITAYLFSRDYNKSFFTKNSVPPGILTLTGEYKKEELEMFRREWAAQLHGVANAFRVPVIASKEGKGAQFQHLKQSNREAEFMKWIDFLITLSTAVYQVAPEEINFMMGSSGSEAPLVAREGGQQVLASKEKGLVPLLRFMQNYYNTYFVSRFSSKYKFEYTGIEFKDQDRNVDLKKKRAFLMTTNELRAEDDLDPLPKLEDIENPFDIPPDNAVIVQAWLQIQTEKRQNEREDMIREQDQAREDMIREQDQASEGSEEDNATLPPGFEDALHEEEELPKEVSDALDENSKDNSGNKDDKDPKAKGEDIKAGPASKSSQNPKAKGKVQEVAKVNNNIQVGTNVTILPDNAKETGNMMSGIVKDVLTNSPRHEAGIKVRLESGDVGRVQSLNDQALGKE